MSRQLRELARAHRDGLGAENIIGDLIDCTQRLEQRMTAQEQAQFALATRSDIIDCPVCHGNCGVDTPVEKGPKMGYEWRRCENCNGSGKVRIPSAPQGTSTTQPTSDPKPIFRQISDNAGFYNIVDKLLTAIRAAILDDDPLGSKVVLIEAMEPVSEELAQLSNVYDDLEALVTNITTLGSHTTPPPEAALIADTATHAAGDYRELLDKAARLYHAAHAPTDPTPSDEWWAELVAAMYAIEPILATEGTLGDTPEAPDYAEEPPIMGQGIDLDELIDGAPEPLSGATVYCFRCDTAFQTTIKEEALYKLPCGHDRGCYGAMQPDTREGD